MARQYRAIGYILGECKSSNPENDFVHYVNSPQFKGMPEETAYAEVDFEEGSIKFLDSNCELIEQFDLISYVQEHCEPVYVNNNYEDWVSSVYKLKG